MTESAVRLCSSGRVGVPVGSRMNVNERRRSQIIERKNPRENKGVLLIQTAHNGLVAGSSLPGPPVNQWLIRPSLLQSSGYRTRNASPRCSPYFSSPQTTDQRLIWPWSFPIDRSYDGFIARKGPSSVFVLPMNGRSQVSALHARGHRLTRSRRKASP